ncbi:hypothetical protein [Nesterenkonia sandarakina]|uniref:Uncharacterized protein n=1 Tax=Nesterenkonia sandarakina TaxID=272918 RepID=A0A2T0YDM6_9MICC|nr:hypothetical protein [Nesterenkonia sandarakina]PRZ12924.1 hypothetical protein BCL67_11726 [Nesterenkonia sandarakina]
MLKTQDSAYNIRPDDDEFVVVTEPSGKEWRIHREDADPEHRFVSYRLAAGWFGNLPAKYAVD